MITEGKCKYRVLHHIASFALVMILAFTANLARAVEPHDGVEHVRVMTFNIRYNNPGDGQDAWPNRRGMVANMIREHADIAGLQEAQIGQIRDLEKQLPGFKWYGVGRDDGKEGGEFCPIFYRSSRYALLDKQTLWLSETPKVPGSKSWDAAITRLITMAQFLDRDSGIKFWVLNTHFDHRGDIAREKSAQLVRQHFSRLAKEQPVIVTGDFNCTPRDKPYAVMTASQSGVGLVDTRSIAKEAPEGPNSTWCGFREIVPGRRIDFIFVGSGIEVCRHRTIGDQVNGRFPSDHLPVVVDLAFEKR